jgi:hypothetical protein
MQISGAIAESVKLNSADGAPITDLNPLPTTSGGGGGSLLADVLLTDGTGALFVGRDDGTAVTYFNLNTNAVYTPTGTIQAAGLTDAQLRATPLPVLDVTSSEAQQSMVLLLTRMLNYLNSPMGYDKSLQRQRATMVVESGTVTTVSAVTSLNNIDTYNARMTVLDTNRTAWAQCVRARIT